MTIQEAIKHLKEITGWANFWGGCYNDKLSAIDMAINVLEKQIPKKIKEEKWIDTKCSCGRILSIHHGDGYYEVPYDVKKQKYCMKCGQALDWSKDND